MEMNTERMLKTMLEKEGRRLTKELSAKFGFNEEEGLKLLRLDELKVKTESKKETKRDKTPKLPLPFCVPGMFFLHLLVRKVLLFLPVELSFLSAIVSP